MEQKIKSTNKHSATIELNGNRYDAHRGTLLSRTPGSLRNNLVDFMPQPKTPRSHAPTSKHVHKTTDRSHTLMRRAVKNSIPKITHAPAIIDGLSTQPKKQAAPKNHLEELRIKRAQQIQKSALISRFGELSNKMQPAFETKPHKTVHALNVVPTPERQTLAHIARLQTVDKGGVSKLLDTAMIASNSHKQPIHKKPKLHHKVTKKLAGSKTTRYAASALSVLLLGGFFAYQSMPNIAVRYAGIKSGVRASLPSYQPAGFAVNEKVEYKPGEVAVSYKANADDRSFTIIQQKTDMDSAALEEQVASNSGTSPQTYPDKGRTIYLYGDSNAAWISEGVLYNISGDSSLSTSQLIKIANSL